MGTGQLHRHNAAAGRAASTERTGTARWHDFRLAQAGWNVPQDTANRRSFIRVFPPDVAAVECAAGFR